MHSAPSLAVIIPTYNEERHIARAIQSVSSVARQIFVIDSGSTDRTCEIAIALGATVLQIPFISFAQKINEALAQAPISCDWVMRLDADEYAEEDLRRLIVEKLPLLASDVTGVFVKRKYVFLGRWIRHGGRYPMYELRLFRSGRAQVEYRLLDEQIVVLSGTTVRLDGNLTDHNLFDLTTFIRKHNTYASSEAMEVMNLRHGLFERKQNLSLANGKSQAAFKRILKERFFNHLPLWGGPLAYFLYRYFLRLGFLDGRSGLIYHTLQGFWYRFLVGAKVHEMALAVAGLHDKEAIKTKVEEMGGRRFL